MAPGRTVVEVADPADDSKSARTRRRILDATAVVLSQCGFAGTRLSDVAKVAQMQAPAIYYYFNSREELIEEVMWVGSQESRRQVSKALDALPPSYNPLDRILVAVEVHLRTGLEISDYATASARNIGQLPARLRDRPAAEQEKYGALWRKLIADAVDAGLCHDELEPRVARMLVLGALNWTPEWWKPARGSLDVVVNSAQMLVRFGLGKPDAPTIFDFGSGPRKQPVARGRAGAAAKRVSAGSGKARAASAPAAKDAASAQTSGRKKVAGPSAPQRRTSKS